MNKSLSAPNISLENVSFAFAGEKIFSSLDFKIQKGIWTCILGPSGCGKTTLLRLISGTLQTESGGIRFDGQPGAAGMTAMMAQKDLLLPWLNVMDNVLLGDRLRGTINESRRKKAAALISKAGLDGCSRYFPSELSGGMRQRVSLLRTLMEERSVILMDEPFSALDALTRMKLQDLAMTMVQGATVVLVTHDPFEALRLGHRIHVLSDNPAKPDEGLELESAPPRNMGEPGLDRLHAELLQRLNQEK